MKYLTFIATAFAILALAGCKQPTNAQAESIANKPAAQTPPPSSVQPAKTSYILAFADEKPLKGEVIPGFGTTTTITFLCRPNPSFRGTRPTAFGTRTLITVRDETKQLKTHTATIAQADFPTATEGTQIEGVFFVPAELSGKGTIAVFLVADSKGSPDDAPISNVLSKDISWDP